MKPATVNAKAHLYKPNTTVRWILEPAHGRTNRRFVGENPPTTPQIYYSLTEAATKVSFKVFDIEGKTLKQWAGSTKIGLNKTAWDMTRPADDTKKEKEDEKKIEKGKKGGQQNRRFAAAGEYRVVMTVDGVEYATTLRLESDPNAPAGRRSADDDVPPPKQID
jgi:hypothetical protein